MNNVPGLSCLVSSPLLTLYHWIACHRAIYPSSNFASFLGNGAALFSRCLSPYIPHTEPLMFWYSSPFMRNEVIWFPGIHAPPLHSLNAHVTHCCSSHCQLQEMKVVQEFTRQMILPLLGPLKQESPTSEGANILMCNECNGEMGVLLNVEKSRHGSEKGILCSFRDRSQPYDCNIKCWTNFMSKVKRLIWGHSLSTTNHIHT